MAGPAGTGKVLSARAEVNRAHDLVQPVDVRVLFASKRR